MELKAGLAGQVGSGRATEIEIRLFATSPVSGELLFKDSNGSNRMKIRLSERQEQIIRLPVAPLPLKPLKVWLSGDGFADIGRELTFEQSDQRLTLVASPIPSYQTFDSHRIAQGITPLILSAEGLPYLSQTYDSVVALVMDQRTLSRLSSDQYHSLADYLSRCGTLLLHRTDQGAVRQLRNSAGCGGRYIEAFNDLTEVAPTLQRLGDSGPVTPPTLTDLLTLRESDQRQQMISALSLFLAGYLLLVVLALWRLQKPQLAMLLPLLAAAAAGLAWNGSSQRSLVSWSETESGDKTMRTFGLLSVGGNRRDDFNLALGEGLQLYPPHEKPRDLVIQYEEDGASRRLAASSPLLVQQHYGFSTLQHKETGYTLSMREGVPLIRFPPRGDLSQTKLIWRGQVFDLPSFPTGGSWRPGRHQGRPPVSPAERLICRRLAFEDAALLMPHSVSYDEIPLSAGYAAGWLVIRPARGETL